MMRTTSLLVALSLLALGGAACAGDDTPPPSPSPSPSSSLQSLAPGQLPTSSPGAATGTVTSGSATVVLSGDLTGTEQLLMLAPPALYSAPPGSFAVVWTDGAQTLGITGMSFEGTRDTSDTLSLTIEVRNGAEATVLTSTAGECSVVVDTALEDMVSGTFDCTRLAGTTAAGDALTVGATGTFTASG